MGRKPVITRHISKVDLDKLYKEENNIRIKERLLAIIHLYEGRNVYEVADILKRSERTIKYWLSRWNEKGYEGLIPQNRNGRKPRMPSSEWDKVIKEIEDKGMTIKDVVKYVKATRGIDYSYTGAWKILRVVKKVKYGKPYIRNNKRPSDAENLLKKRIDSVLTPINDPIFGFLDESSLQQRPNTRRVLNTHIINYQPGKCRSMTVFGFIALNGNDEVMVSGSSKEEDLMRFAQRMRSSNIMRPICVLVDNARIHSAKKFVALAQELDIHLIYNIPYSPDLNPIEFGWKDFKRDISKYTDFDEAIEVSQDCALEIFYSKKDGYSKSWTEKFFSAKS
jgi:putative transposase